MDSRSGNDSFQWTSTSKLLYTRDYQIPLTSIIWRGEHCLLTLILLHHGNAVKCDQRAEMRLLSCHSIEYFDRLIVWWSAAQQPVFSWQSFPVLRTVILVLVLILILTLIPWSIDVQYWRELQSPLHRRCTEDVLRSGLGFSGFWSAFFLVAVIVSVVIESTWSWFIG